MPMPLQVSEGYQGLKEIAEEAFTSIVKKTKRGRRSSKKSIGTQ